MLRGSVTVVVTRTHPRSIPLAMITMRKSTHGFPFLSYMSMGVRLAALRTAGASLMSHKCPISVEQVVGHPQGIIGYIENVLTC